MKKIVSLLVAASFSFFPKALSEDLPFVQEVSTGELFSEEYLPPLPLFVSPEAEHDCTVPTDISFLEKSAQEIFTTALKKVPCHLMQTLKVVEILDNPEMPRALAGRFSLKLRSDVFDKPEIEALLLHEFAHVIDLGGLVGSANSGESAFVDGSTPIFQNDPSLRFYEISWKNSSERKSEMSELDFVSGYAMTDPFEDFSESFLMYRLHGKTFLELAATRPILQKKYEFFRDIVFEGKEFKDNEVTVVMDSRPWDTTKL